MSNDLLMVLGLIMLMLAFPAVVGAFSESRPPRAGALLIVAACLCIATAMTRNPGGYAFGEIPALFVKVFSDFAN